MTEPTATALGQPDAVAASRAVKLAWLCVAIAALVLIIDLQIKRHIVRDAERALKLYGDVQKIVREADRGGSEPAGEASASPGDSVNPDHGVDDASGASAEPVPDAGNGLGPPSSWFTGPSGGTSGNV